MTRRLLLVAVVTLVGVVGLQELADATRNEHDHHVTGSTSEVVVDVRTRRADPDLGAQGLWASCHLTVGFAEVVEPIARVHGGPADRYSVTVTPALGEHDIRRLQGCLQDGTVDRVWGDVVSIRDTTPGGEGRRGSD